LDIKLNVVQVETTREAQETNGSVVPPDTLERHVLRWTSKTASSFLSNKQKQKHQHEPLS